MEQPRLGSAVSLHGPVIVEMIARKIGEQRGLEGHAVHPALVEPVGGDFHRYAARAPLAASRRSVPAAQPRPAWCAWRASARRGSRCRACPTTAARPPQLLSALRDPVRARGLAVGAGDAGHPQLAGGLRRRRAPAMVRQARRAIRRTGRFGTLHAGSQSNPAASHNTAAAPRGDRLRNVDGGRRLRSPGIATKTIAGPNPPAVAWRAALILHAQSVERRRDRNARPCSSPLPSLPGWRRTASRSKRRVGRHRTACAARSAITALNTGAATAPP